MPLFGLCSNIISDREPMIQVIANIVYESGGALDDLFIKDSGKMPL